MRALSATWHAEPMAAASPGRTMRYADIVKHEQLPRELANSWPRQRRMRACDMTPVEQAWPEASTTARPCCTAGSAAKVRRVPGGGA